MHTVVDPSAMKGEGQEGQGPAAQGRLQQRSQCCGRGWVHLAHHKDTTRTGVGHAGIMLELFQLGQGLGPGGQPKRHARAGGVHTDPHGHLFLGCTRRGRGKTGGRNRRATATQ